MTDIMRDNYCIAIAENFGIDFINFRVSYANFLKSKGYDIIAIIPNDGSVESIEDAGLKVFTYDLKKNSLNPFNLIRNIRIFRQIQKEQGIDLFHSFRLQPNIIASLAFAFRKSPSVISHITGLGYAFSSTTPKSLFYRMLILLLYQVSLVFSKKVIVQNKADFAILSRLFFISRKLILIESSGIDISKFSRDSVDMDTVADLRKKLLFEDGEKIVTFTGRLLREKGILEYLAAAEYITSIDNRVKFVIAGWFDKFNPSCITKETLDRYRSNKNIIYLGGISEIRELLYLTNVFVLPTYREGFPRSVLEAMSMSVPVVTTDVPGAADAVTDNFNGLITKPRNTESIITSINKLLYDDNLSVLMGQNGRQLVEDKYRSECVYSSFYNVYPIQ